MTTFVEVEFEPESDDDDPISLRWKATVGPFVVKTLVLEGVTWRAQAIAVGGELGDATGAMVEDSSDGVALLVRGGLRGVRLRDDASGRERREPYLLLSRDTEWG